MRFLLSSILLLLVANAAAEECTEAKPVASGHTVVCDGVLLPGQWVEECIHLKEVQLPKLGLELTACEEELDATLNVYGAFRAQCETHVAELEDLARNTAGISQPWYENKMVWGAVGIVLGAAGTYVLVTKQ